MKKIYEAPKMLIEVVCVEDLLAASPDGLPVFGNSDKRVDNDNALLGKDREDSDWGGLW